MSNPRSFSLSRQAKEAAIHNSLMRKDTPAIVGVTATSARLVSIGNCLSLFMYQEHKTSAASLNLDFCLLYGIPVCLFLFYISLGACFPAAPSLFPFNLLEQSKSLLPCPFGFVLLLLFTAKIYPTPQSIRFHSPCVHNRLLMSVSDLSWLFFVTQNSRSPPFQSKDAHPLLKSSKKMFQITANMGAAGDPKASMGSYSQSYGTICKSALHSLPVLNVQQH